MIKKINLFGLQAPLVSVIIPIARGESSRHYSRLVSELSAQSFQDFELIFVMSEQPNGHARNVGVESSNAKYLVFIDETTSLGSPKIIAKLLKPWLNEAAHDVGMTGATIKPRPALNSFQRQYFSMRTFESPTVVTNTESWQVQHPCMAIPRHVFDEVGGESDWLITGTDDDLRMRVHQAGYKMILVPDSVCYYLPPSSLVEVWRKAFVKGRGSAYAFTIFPGLFPFASFFGKPVRSRWAGVMYTLLSVCLKTILPWYWFNPVALAYQWIFAFGFMTEWRRQIFKKSESARRDLPGTRSKLAVGIK